MLPLRSEQSTTEGNFHPSSAADPRSRSSYYLHSYSESDSLLTAVAATAAGTAAYNTACSAAVAVGTSSRDDASPLTQRDTAASLAIVVVGTVA